MNQFHYQRPTSHLPQNPLQWPKKKNKGDGSRNIIALKPFKAILFIASCWLLFVFTYGGRLLLKNGGVARSNHHDETNFDHLDHYYNENQTGQSGEDASTFLTMYGRHRFEQSFHNLPEWLQDYFNWHRIQTSKKNISDNKYVVLLCLPKDTLCGGLSDRLRPLPFYLFIAKYTNRLLCIHWEKPFGLDQFLQPIQGLNNNGSKNNMGIDWRCPSDVRDGHIYDSSRPFNEQPNVKLFTFGYCQKNGNKIPFAPCIEKDISNLKANIEDMYVTIDLATHSNDCINNAILLAQRHSYGGDDSDTNRDNNGNENETNFLMPQISHWQYSEMISDIFRVMFEPVPTLARQINATMTKLGLVEGQYVTAHVRARYPAGFIVKYMNGDRNQTFDKDGGLTFEDKGQLKNWIEKIVQNAIKCGYLLAPNLPLFFVSDHNEATNFALSNDVDVSQKGHPHTKTIRAIGIDRKDEPLHMDGNNNKKSSVGDFFSVFEDLLIMGGSKCVAHGIGSFGSFGAGLAGNKCRAVHRKYNAQPVQCPNDRGDRTSVPILADEMLSWEKPGGRGKIKYFNKN